MASDDPEEFFLLILRRDGAPVGSRNILRPAKVYDIIDMTVHVDIFRLYLHLEFKPFCRCHTLFLNFISLLFAIMFKHSYFCLPKQLFQAMRPASGQGFCC